MLTTLLLTLAVLPPPDSTPPKRFSLLPLPLLYYSPETRLGYGLAATATFRFRGDTSRQGFSSGIRPSQVTAGVAYTQNRQLLVYLPFQLFYRNNQYFANGELGYYRYSYFYFGQGPRDVPAELYGVDFPRVRLNVFRRITPADPARPGRGLYAGLRYQYENYKITSTVPEGELAGGNVPGGLGSRFSGVGTGLFYDSRDNVFYPSCGLMADLTYLTNGWNETDQPGRPRQRFGRYVADVASYHPLGRRTTLALNYVLGFTSGEAPFNAQSLLGGTRRGRGFYEGRYRDSNLALLQAELRLRVWGRLGVVGFGSVGTLGGQADFLRMNDPKIAYGAGLRVRVNRDLVNIRLDYGRGVPYASLGASGLYLTIGEAF